MPNARVSAAGGAMTAVTAFYEITPATRHRIEWAVESLLALLDELDGDPDREPSFGFVPSGYLDEQEDENEHGGDILDQPHDDLWEDDEDGHDAEAVDEDGDPCDHGEPDGFLALEPWEGFRAHAEVRR